MKAIWIGSCLLLAAGATRVEAQTIDWEVLHRYRVITNDRHEALFLRKILGGGAGTEVLGDLYGLRPTDVLNSLEFGFDTAWNGTAAQYAPSWFHDPRRKIRVRLSEKALRALRRAGPNRPNPACTFWVNDRPVGQAQCREGLEAEAELGRAVVSWAAHPGERRMTARTDEAIVIRDIKIASIGDSFSSGEGNPHTRYVFGSLGAPAQWWDDRCHRSLVSSGALAAARLAVELKQASITFVSYACSGAEIRPGILSEYLGRETVEQIEAKYRDQNRAPNVPFYRGRHLPAQMDRLRTLLCRPGALGCLDSAKLDLLLIGTGGNEIGFGNLVRHILAGSADRDSERIIAEVERELRRLSGELAELAQQVTRLEPRQTALVSYLDPTKDEDGLYCGRKRGRPAMGRGWDLFGFGISEAEARLAAEHIIDPLSNLHQAVADQAGWLFVKDLQRNRGVCARPSWFRDYPTAQRLQDYLRSDATVRGGFPTGVMHPNYFGQRHISERIYRSVLPLLAEPPESFAVSSR